MFLSLVFKAVKSDISSKRMAAFSKRLMQVNSTQYLKIKERFRHSFECLETLQSRCFTPQWPSYFGLQFVEGCIEFAIQCLKESSICRLLYRELLSLLVGVFYYYRRFSSQDLLYGKLLSCLELEFRL